MRKSLNKSLILLVFVAGLSTEALAQVQYDRRFYRKPMREHHQYYADRSSNMISASQAKRIAEDRFGGKALSATLEDGGSAGSVYRVKIIKGGRVKVVTIQAAP